MKVRDLLTDESKWAKGAYARDSEGNAVSSHSESAVSWCLFTAICKCYGYGTVRNGRVIERFGPEVIDRVEANLPHLSIVEWSDAPERTFADVKALVERLDI